MLWNLCMCSGPLDDRGGVLSSRYHAMGTSEKARLHYMRVKLVCLLQNAHLSDMYGYVTSHHNLLPLDWAILDFAALLQTVET